MRLTCPTCAAVYELPDDQLPAGGSHVQCTACHTRWFARAQPATAERPSEDEIIARLETRSARPAPLAAVPAAPPPAWPGGGGSAPIAFPAPPRPRGPAVAPVAPAEAASPEGATTPAVDSPHPPERAPTPLRPRVSDQTPPAAPVRPAAPAALPEPARRRGGTAGFLLALALAAISCGAYLRADDIEARLPAIGPTLAAYVEQVNSARVWIETRLGPIRDRLNGA